MSVPAYHLNQTLFGWVPVEVGWPSNPLVLDHWIDDTANRHVHWLATVTKTAEPEQRPLSFFQKVWPLGSEGSGPYDFTNTPEATELLNSAGGPLYDGSFAFTSLAPFLSVGPLWLQNGDALTDADRPARVYLLSRLAFSTSWGYRATIGIAPTLDKYHYTFKPVGPVPGNSHTITAYKLDGSVVTSNYVGFGTWETDYDATDVVAAAMSDFSGLDGATLTNQTNQIKAERVNDHYPIPVNASTGWSRINDPAAVSYGGLDVDFSGVGTETITL